MNTNSVIQRLWELGHFITTDVTKGELPDVQLHDPSARIAIDSYRDIMDSPETTLEELFAIERCGCPDYSVEAANGGGSWPVGCHPEYPGVHSFALFIDKSGMPGYLRGVFDQAWMLCRQAYADIGIAFFEVDSKSQANTVVTWQRGKGWIGLAIVPRSPRCNERIWAKFDNRYQPRDMINQWARLLAHEFCHNMGLSHTRGGIMNPSITSGVFTETAWRGDPSESALVRFFGGDPVQLGGDVPGPEPPNPPKPEPPKGPNEFWFKGDFTLMQGDTELDDYILVPKPRV